MTRRRSWRMRRTCHSPPSWAQYFGTRLCLMMVTIFSWSTWTLKNFCRKMVSHLVYHNTSKTSVLSSSRPLSLSWTSAAESAPPSTPAWSLSPASRVPHEQVPAMSYQNRNNIPRAKAGSCDTPCLNEPYLCI